MKDYEYVKVSIDEDDGLSIRYRVRGAEVVGRDGIDDDCSEWSDDDIRKTVGIILDIPRFEFIEIEIVSDA